MASRRTSTMLTNPSLKSSSTDTKSPKSESNASKLDTTVTGKKTVKPSVTFVKSRYMQSAEKASLSKSNSLTNESIAAPLRPSSPKPGGVKSRVGTPPRRSMPPQAPATSMMSQEAEPLVLGKSILQSTFSDGPGFRPNFDISVINEKTILEKAKTILEKAVEPERNTEINKGNIEAQAFLLAYLTAKMESNTAKAEAEAEAWIMEVMEEEEALHNEVQEKKRRYLLAEKDRLANEILDLQIAALTPVVETAKQFTNDYKTFATAVDATRHELPVKNFYIDGDRREFLDKAQACLKVSETLLMECTEGDHEGNTISLECLRDIKTTSKTIRQQLSGTLSDLLELSSLVGRHAVHAHQATEEEQLGTARTSQLFCPKK
ncbi:HAUS augmin-like complex subunit 8 [Pseudoliparis swirei]|uniref:HAUS augmin-like complex subunit 8 n=1 Tax=Pseudoliparis swirei TaxID=2059687 RepID=UPI0024BE3BE8|nr:HAUS augmin-like complex subunit 8 [Pseudoliparis swirei]